MMSKKGKRTATIATLTASLLMMGGAAFAAPTSGVDGGAGIAAGLVPDPVGQAAETARNTIANVRNQIHRQQW
jgi:hypothetical protein